MNTIRKIFRYPVVRLALRGAVKALIVAFIASLLLVGFVDYQLYGPAFDTEYHFLGTASEFFMFALVLTTIFSIPVSLLVDVLLTIFLRIDKTKNRISYKRSFIAGFLIGMVMSIFGIFIFAYQVGDNMIYLSTVLLASIAGGLGGLWMTKDALILFPQNIEVE